MSHLATEKSNVCQKYDIPLLKSREDNTYFLSFRISNESVNLRNIINFNLYTFLAKINDDCIESVILIEKLSESSATFLFLFKSIGKDFGIPKKYMFIETNVIQEDSNTLSYISKSIPISEKAKSLARNYDRLTCNSSILKISLDTNHHANVCYNFNLNLHEDLPIYMKDLPGLMMKKIFYNLKLFIENLE